MISNINDLRKLFITTNKRDIGVYLSRILKNKTYLTDVIFSAQLSIASKKTLEYYSHIENSNDVFDFNLKNTYKNLGYDSSNKLKFSKFVEDIENIKNLYDLQAYSYDFDTIEIVKNQELHRLSILKTETKLDKVGEFDRANYQRSKDGPGGGL